MRRAVVLGDMVGPEAGSIAGLRDFEAIVVLLAETAP